MNAFFQGTPLSHTSYWAGGSPAGFPPGGPGGGPFVSGPFSHSTPTAPTTAKQLKTTEMWNTILNDSSYAFNTWANVAGSCTTSLSPLAPAANTALMLRLGIWTNKTCRRLLNTAEPTEMKVAPPKSLMPDIRAVPMGISLVSRNAWAMSKGCCHPRPWPMPKRAW